MQNTIERLRTHQQDPRINQRNLSYFFVAAMELNFTRAATKLGVAQPSLSRGIVLLEDAIGGKLFDRIGKTVRLTALGKKLLPSAEFFLNQRMDFSDFLVAMRHVGNKELRISAVSTLTAELLPRLLSEFEQANPSIPLQLSDGINDEIVSRVISGSVELGITTTPEDTSLFQTKLLFKDCYAIAVNSSHRFFEREVVCWAELESEAIATFEKDSSTYQDIEQAFRSVNLYFNPTTFVKYRNTLMGLVRHQGVITILPKLAIQEHIQPNVRAIPIFDPIVERSYYLLSRKNLGQSVELKKLEDFLNARLATE